MSAPSDSQRMEKIVSLCKRRGFIFQSSEIYGGLNGAWDYGPLGVELKRNLKNYWWRAMVHERDDVVGMDGSILMNRAVWRASGHEDTFIDLMRECPFTGKRVRVDQVEPQSGTVIEFAGACSRAGWRIDGKFRVLMKPNEHIESFRKRVRLLVAENRSPRIADRKLSVFKKDSETENEWQLRSAFTEKQLTSPSLQALRFETGGSSFEITADKFWGKAEDIDLVGEQKAGAVTDSVDFHPETRVLMTEPRPFNLMFKTYVGATENESSITYLRPETAQAIFVQFKNVLEVSRKKLPFGIAQIGKAFRNEINPRNFTFRSREFEQMELEYFCRADEGMKWLDYWLEERLKFYENIGIPRTKLHAHEIPDAERAFYSKGTYDIEFDFPFGRQELEGVAYRTDYDLQQHQRASGKSLEYFDEETKQRFIPHVVEPSAGVDRTVLALICEAYDEDTAPDEKGKLETRIVLRFHPRMAPIKCAVFPLLKNKEPLVAKAKEIIDLLRPHMNVFYDEGGAIGRRYRRQDEIGTPFGVTVDFETLGEKDPALRETVTLRDRDSMKQERVPITELVSILTSRIR
jgi:glycyl-tRNA synthetase